MLPPLDAGCHAMHAMSTEHVNVRCNLAWRGLEFGYQRSRADASTRLAEEDKALVAGF